jgi:hypothetical protein
MLRRGNIHRRGQHRPDTGRRVDDESLVIFAELVIGLANDETLPQIAATLEHHLRRTVTRKQFDERRKRLEEIGRSLG